MRSTDIQCDVHQRLGVGLGNEHPRDHLEPVPPEGDVPAHVLQGLAPGEYRWSVQAIDGAWEGSVFAPEGQFIIARTGRLVRAADGSQALFVLDADGAQAPEPPMIIHACKLLETMEQTVMKQGDNVPFIITGQVFMYRGANYLLPTIVKREFDPGNLE